MSKSEDVKKLHDEAINKGIDAAQAAYSAGLDEQQQVIAAIHAYTKHMEGRS